MAEPNEEGLKQEAVAQDSSGSLETAGNHGEQEEIMQLAHQLWMERGCPIGTPEEDWFRAEEEIRLRASKRQQAAGSV